MTSCINFVLSFFSPKRKKKEKERFGKRFPLILILINVDLSKIREVFFIWF